MADSDRMKLLIIGGSGFVSGTLARVAVEHGHEVAIVTRGQRPVPAGVSALVADRKAAGALERAVADCGGEWDMVVDCIGYEPEDARQDVAVFAGRCGHLVFISTDFVYDPARRLIPQPFDSPYYIGDGYGGKKRLCEVELEQGDLRGGRWTVLRPCHIYGPGSQLGCLPLHGRDPELISRLKACEPLKLVGGGHFLQQPIFARDLAGLILSVRGKALLDRRILCSAGPDIIESVRYYAIVAEYLGVPLRVEELPVAATLRGQPDLAPFLCHRVYDLSPLRLAGLRVPNTPIAEGLAEHVRSLL